MGKRNVVIKAVDEELYRKAKAKAALLGIKIPDAVNEALRGWIQSKQSRESLEELANRSELEGKLPELIRRYEGKYVAVAKGRVMGTYETLEEAFQAMSELAREGAQHGYVTKIEPKKTVTIELGASVYAI